MVNDMNAPPSPFPAPASPRERHPVIERTGAYLGFISVIGIKVFMDGMSSSPEVTQHFVYFLLAMGVAAVLGTMSIFLVGDYSFKAKDTERLVYVGEARRYSNRVRGVVSGGLSTWSLPSSAPSAPSSCYQ
ncbi:MAG: hypothetical protein KAT70_00185 [Thermoplasmata archaeon]|nr:hypothetical protein [Thermoplasmata archaeon]